MPQVINTNIASLNAQRNLNTSQTALATALQRLSSGLRINSAKDDAAGLAISERFTTQIRGLNQAVRNSNDGISLSQTGEGALAEIMQNLQRIRELAVQSVNATNSNSDRAALDAEVQQRLAEIDRISAQTSFNGQKVLDGSFGSAVFQVGANVGETITLSLQTSTRTNAIGSVATATSSVNLNTLFAGSAATPTTTTALGAVTVDAVSNADGQQFQLAIDGIDVINVTQAGGSPETIDTARLQAAFDAFDTAQAGYTISGSLATNDLVVSKADGTDAAVTLTNTFNTAGTITGSGAFVATHTNGTPAVAGASVTVSGDFTIQIGSATAVSVADGTYSTADSLVAAINSAVGNNANATFDSTTGFISIVAGEAVTIAGNTGLTTLGFTASNAVSGNLTTTNVLTVASSNTTIQQIDSALTAVNSLRSNFGAIQNRFESVIANLQTTSENLTASRSRIQDADFAAETAALTRAQILQQAGVAMLAQANALPNNVLTLLRG